MEEKKKGSFPRADHEGRELVRRLYPTKTAPEIAELTGRSCSFVYKWAHEYGLEHDEATAERTRRQTARNLMKSHNPSPEIIRRRVEARKKTRAREELRVKYGLPRQTRLRLRAIPTRHQKARYYLSATYGYLLDEDEPFSIYYDGDTRRAKGEAYFTKKYGFEFKEDK